jgi:thermitase
MFNKRFLIVGAALAAVSSVSFAGEYLVKLKGGVPFSTLSNNTTFKGFKVKDQHAPAGLIKIHIPELQKVLGIAKILKMPGVEYVVPNFKLKSFSNPMPLDVTVNALRDQWAIKKVNAEAAWARAGNKGSNKVLVAVIDTGVDYNHAALKPNMVQGFNFKDNNNDPMDKTSSQNPGHGTHCAGIVGASGLSDNGTIGISPEVSMMPLRFLDENGSGDLMDGIKAIDYAIEKGAKVISASWGATVSRSQAQPLVDAVKRADDAGVIFVVAAANDGKNNDSTEVYPANAGFPNTISVAASDSNDSKPSWSNFGTASVHVAAPGADIMSTLPKNTYGKLSGTSMATPLVSGMVALLLAQDSSLTGSQVRALLQTTGAKVSIETACNCRVDALAAMNQLLDKKMWLVPAAATIKPNETMVFSALNAKGTVSYEVSNATVAKISATGELTALAEGNTTVTAKDSNGQIAQSLAVHVKTKSDDGGGGGGGECFLGDQALCDAMCQFLPELPWCSQ